MEKYFTLNIQQFPADTFTPTDYQLKDTALYKHHFDSFDDAFSHLYLFSAGRLDKNLSIKYHNDFYVQSASVHDKAGLQLIKLEEERLHCNFSYASESLKRILNVELPQQASIKIPVPATGIYAEMPGEYKAVSDFQKMKFAKADMFDLLVRKVITKTPEGSQFPDGYVDLTVTRHTSLREAYNQMLTDSLTPEGLLRAQRPGMKSEGWYIHSLAENAILLTSKEIHSKENHGLYKPGIYHESYHRAYLRTLLKEDPELRKIIREPLIEKTAIAISNTDRFDEAIATPEMMRYIKRNVPELRSQQIKQNKVAAVPKKKKGKSIK